MTSQQSRIETSGEANLAGTHFSTILSLSDTDREIVHNRLRGSVRSIKSGYDVFQQGSIPQHAIIILEGWAAVTRTLPDGRRSTQSILLPTDLHDLDLFSSRKTDHALTAIGPLTYIELRHERIRYLADEYPGIGMALWRHDARAAANQRELIVSLGCRTALERIAHFFCELFARLAALGRVHQGRCEIPLKQSDLAEATGLTPVHVNRVLQQLRATGFIVFGKRELIVNDIARLKRLAYFSNKGVGEEFMLIKN